MSASLVGSEMCIRDRPASAVPQNSGSSPGSAAYPLQALEGKLPADHRFAPRSLALAPTSTRHLSISAGELEVGAEPA
eukprot:5304726-Alexandrium_andersonii.AAC.1